MIPPRFHRATVAGAAFCLGVFVEQRAWLYFALGLAVTVGLVLMREDELQ